MTTAIYGGYFVPKNKESQKERIYVLYVFP